MILKKLTTPILKKKSSISYRTLFYNSISLRVIKNLNWDLNVLFKFSKVQFSTPTFEILRVFGSVFVYQKSKPFERMAFLLSETAFCARDWRMFITSLLRFYRNGRAFWARD